MNGALWGIMIAAVVGGIIGYISNVFLDKGRYRREYQKEIIKKKIEAYQIITITINDLKIILDKDIASKSERPNLRKKFDELLRIEIPKYFIFISPGIKEKIGILLDQLRKYQKISRNSKDLDMEYKIMRDRINDFLNEMRIEIWDIESINF